MAAEKVAVFKYVLGITHHLLDAGNYRDLSR